MTTALHCPPSLLRMRLAGQVMTGAWASFTVTVKEQVAVKAAPSLTLRVTLVVPTGKMAPLARPLAKVTVAPGQLSVTVGA